MQEPEIIHPGGRAKVQPGSSWFSAYVKFLGNRDEHRTLKLMPLVLLGVVPLSIADDLFLPVFGVIDDLPTALVVAAVVGMTYARVRKYR